MCTPGPQPQGSDRSVHPWTSTARIRSQCAPLDLNSKDPIAVCTLDLNRKDPIAACIPGSQPQGSDRSVHPWTSTTRIRSQCAPLDLNRKDPSVGCTPGPHPQGFPRSVHLDLDRKDPIAMCIPGPQPQGSDRNVHRWASTK